MLQIWYLTLKDCQFPVPENEIVNSLLEQLSYYLPLLNVCLVYDKNGQQQSIARTYAQEKITEFSSLVVEQWWQDSIRFEQVNHIASTRNCFVYVYPFSADYKPDFFKIINQPEYLLTVTKYPLDNSQQNYLQYQGKLLCQYLKFWRLCQYQQTKISTLEQVIQHSEHQLRHLVASIALYAENLYLGLSDDPLQEQAGIIKEITQELRQHLSELFSGEQSPESRRKPQDLQAIFHESLQHISLFLVKKKLTIDYSQTSAIAIVDSWQIKQVFDNVLNNAIHFSPIGGKITCTWQVFQQEMIVEIRDRGSGFSLQALQQALDSDYSEREGGTGRGLAIAKKIILAHQGRFWLDNLPEGGAQVSFTLPRYLVNS